jgi:uncharacterized protein (DUF2235 family)
MGKQVAFCADGTWDDPQSDTNVIKLSRALIPSSSLVPFYDDGVGADGTLLQKLTGGAFGAGIFQKIQDGYAQIAGAYVPGDDLFLFGFSRGAYTARSLAGMIAISGLPSSPPTPELLATAFQAYRNPAQRSTLLPTLTAAGFFDAKIKMVGVWETVGALGIPALNGEIDPITYGFLDTTLHPDVLNAFHAIAIDEERVQFSPTLWTSAPASGQTMQQVWFAGVHGDVGGGYPISEAGLADITLGWIAVNALALGLNIDPDFMADYGSIDPETSLQEIHQSWSFFPWGLARSRTISTTSSLGSSVAIRVQDGNTYDPSNLLYSSGDVASAYTIVPVVENPQC